MGISPLQFHQVTDWLRIRDINDHETIEEYVYFIFELDAEYMDFANKQQNKQITQTSHVTNVTSRK